jgi:hypothetical protein
MRLENGTFCPLIKKDCAGLKCAWFTKVVGYDMNTGKEVDEYQCAIAWLPMLLIENSGQQRQTGAAVESFRNEMVKANQVSHHILMSTMSTASPNVIEEPKPKRISRSKK